MISEGSSSGPFTSQIMLQKKTQDQAKSTRESLERIMQLLKTASRIRKRKNLPNTTLCGKWQRREREREK